MNVIRKLVLCLNVLCLISCATPIKNNSTKQCLNSCIQKFESCRQSCVNNCARCSATESHKSSTNYTKYIHEKQISGEFIARELNSYRDPLQCRKITCNCSADLSACKQNCTGVIQKRLEAVPFCT